MEAQNLIKSMIFIGSGPPGCLKPYKTLDFHRLWGSRLLARGPHRSKKQKKKRKNQKIGVPGPDFRVFLIFCFSEKLKNIKNEEYGLGPRFSVFRFFFIFIFWLFAPLELLGRILGVGG